MNWRYQTSNPYDTESDDPMTREDAMNEEQAEARDDAHAAIGDMGEAMERYINAMTHIVRSNNPWHNDAKATIETGLLSAIRACDGGPELAEYIRAVFR